MTGLYPYCVVPAGCEPPEGSKGIGGATVRCLRVGTVAVWVSDAESAPELDVARVELHHEVVTAAAESTSPVPIRFGAWSPDAETLSLRIEGRMDALESALEAVRNRVEFGLRIDAIEEEGEEGPSAVARFDLESSNPESVSHEPALDPSGTTTGRAHLRALSRSYAARRARRGLQAGIVAEVGTCLADLDCAERVTYLDAPGLVSVAHLVGRDLTPAYRERVERFVEGLPSTRRAHVTGPWPPYSFTTE